jgi:hypothetical protein
VRRAGLIAAGVVGALLIAAGAAWLVAFRDTAEPSSVGEAVTSFRSDTGPASASLPIRSGVYVYATTGFEKTDALTGVTHRYPRKSTITVTAAGCGMSLAWRVLKGRTTTWTYCVTDEGWRVRSQDELHTFFGHPERTTYACPDTLIEPATPSMRQRWPIVCSTGDTTEKGTLTVVGREPVDVGGAEVPAWHVRKVTTFTGANTGTARHDLWFPVHPGAPVKIVMVSHTASQSPIGQVHYDEVVTLRLRSLEPLR